MNDAFQVGAVGLAAQQRALDGIANNIANVNTPAFKRAQLRFADVVARSGDDVAVDPAKRALLAGVTLDSQLMLNESGEIEQTGQTMDVAIEGRGFIELMAPGGQTLLWRGGALKINEDGSLASSRGFALRAAITVPSDATALEIGGDGIVKALVADSSDPIELGQIQLVRIEDSSAVDRLDGGLYRLRDGAIAREAVPGEEGAGLLVQGAIERSNVELTTEMIQLMLVQRAFAASAQIVQAADQMMAVANNLSR